MGVSYQVPWTCVCSRCLNVLSPDPYLKVSLPCSRLSSLCSSLRNLGLLSASLSSRGQNEEGFEHLSFFSVLCHQVTCPTQMQDHIFFLLLLRYLLVFLSLSALPTSNSKQALALLTPYSVPGSPVHAPTCSTLFFFGLSVTELFFILVHFLSPLLHFLLIGMVFLEIRGNQ